MWLAASLPVLWVLHPAGSTTVLVVGSVLAVAAIVTLLAIWDFFNLCWAALVAVWDETRRAARGLVERWQVLAPMRVFAPAGVDGFDVYVRAKPRWWAKGSKTPYGVFAVTYILKIA